MRRRFCKRGPCSRFCSQCAMRDPATFAGYSANPISAKHLRPAVRPCRTRDKRADAQNAFEAGWSQYKKDDDAQEFGEIICRPEPERTIHSHGSKSASLLQIPLFLLCRCSPSSVIVSECLPPRRRPTRGDTGPPLHALAPERLSHASHTSVGHELAPSHSPQLRCS